MSSNRGIGQRRRRLRERQERKVGHKLPRDWMPSPVIPPLQHNVGDCCSVGVGVLHMLWSIQVAGGSSMTAHEDDVAMGEFAMNGPISSRGDSCAIVRVPSDSGEACMEARSCCFALIFLSLTFSQSTFSACDDAHFLGKLEHRCPHCHALHWIGERLVNSSMSKPLFGSCCLKGKVQLEFVDPLPPDLYWYY
ncbi:hypothetical protein V8E53_001481, partial [Lactarius tabidus]